MKSKIALAIAPLAITGTLLGATAADASPVPAAAPAAVTVLAAPAAAAPAAKPATWFHG